jgi:hypothetical protein
VVHTSGRVHARGLFDTLPKRLRDFTAFEQEVLLGLVKIDPRFLVSTARRHETLR